MAVYDPKKIYSGSYNAALTEADARRKKLPAKPAAPQATSTIPAAMPRVAAVAKAAPTLGARQPGAPIEQTAAAPLPQIASPQPAAQAPMGPAAPYNVSARARKAELDGEFAMRQKAFIQDKQAGRIKFGSDADLEGAAALRRMGQEREQYGIAGRQPDKILSPEENTRNSANLSNQAAAIVGNDINQARAKGLPTAEMEARLSGLQQRNIGMTREQAIESASKMLGGAGMGGMLAAGQDVQDGMKRVTPDWQAKGQQYTEGQGRVAQAQRDESERAYRRAKGLEETRMAGEDFASDMESGQRDIARGSIRADRERLAAQESEYRRIASGQPKPLTQMDEAKVTEAQAKAKLYAAQADAEARKYLPNSIESTKERMETNDAQAQELQIPELENAARTAIPAIEQAFSNFGTGKVVGTATTGNIDEQYGALMAISTYADQLAKMPPDQARIAAIRYIASLPKDMQGAVQADRSTFNEIFGAPLRAIGVGDHSLKPRLVQFANDLNTTLSKLRAIAGIEPRA